MNTFVNNSGVNVVVLIVCRPATDGGHITSFTYKYEEIPDGIPNWDFNAPAIPDNFFAQLPDANVGKGAFWNVESTDVSYRPRKSESSRKQLIEAAWRRRHGSLAYDRA